MEISALKKIGQRIRDLRKQKGLSQEQLAEKAGFHFSYIGGVERAEKNITLVNLLKIADALDVQIMDLFMYTKYQQSALNEKDELLNQIFQTLVSLKKRDLRKVQIMLDEFFEK
ncbi:MULTISPECIES: helix-turn-helix transcriptional regulator [Paenibacillus]|uniref:Helix-turn-helix transcriptional regulator n=1 Tax=Paenibacillus tianjinensis TaxID=2810347 RepID=A0ABX7LJ92_9BACL|nr:MULTISPECIES: helix-turn-helix transcriptional regulator [Paenibacillus]MDF9839675.1 transcriptional regulator with XRE-family HTH domain [Paenibacillus sp. PastF-2]MDF9846255.1 transcriptional regulator with XRE-family HTH domain [Paenibacillus sp. PastM-2]MDF9852828.1 transcriptional regulator with XRE-family HTH domain [Paenibacillus sp. PastF-1]MDH6477443.1 transcriptional regulator with XRE-family HTH domain [Paenibacillus sp. PastH-2]QSF47516.1 helix-turn-helix transcriptional regulat